MRSLMISIIILLSLDGALLAKPSLKFGVFAYRSKAVVEQEYQPLMDYLNKNLKETSIELSVLQRDELDDALQKNRLDILMTNPSHYEIIRNYNMFSRVIATMVRIQDGVKTDSFGGVIITSASNTSVNTIKDLKNKSIAMMGAKSLGGYQAQVYECLQNGVDIEKQTKRIIMKNHEDIVQAVLERKTEAGFIRTGIIESMVKEGSLSLSDIRIVNSQNMAYFPYLLSTRLYPEWPVSILPHVDEKIAKELIVLLLSFNPDLNTTVNVGGFVLPQNYKSIESLAKALGLPPYDTVEAVTWEQVYIQYRTELTVLVLSLLFLIVIISTIMRLNLRIRSSEERFEMAIEGTNDGLFDWNMLDNSMFHSKRFETMLGYSGDELPQTLNAWEDLLHPEDKEQAHKAVEEYVRSKGKAVYASTFRMRAKDGSWKWIEGRGKAVFNADGQAVRFVGFNTDITQKKENELLLIHAAQHDALTNLPNRTLLSNLMPVSLAGTKRHGMNAALLFIDLDGFKEVNDDYGHEIGDILLKNVAVRIQDLVRDEDIVSRLGGDEFAILVSDLKDREEIAGFVSRLLEEIGNPYLIDSHELYVSASIGISFYPQSTDVTADVLLRQADQAMYDAKFNGKNQYYYFDERLDESKKLGHDEIGRLRHAIEQDELLLHYQPKVNMCTGEVVGAEALVRWNDPAHGLVYPDNFLPFIENHPMIFMLDSWVLENVFRQIIGWNEQSVRISVSINISAYSFKESGFIDLLSNMLIKYPEVSPSQVGIEILETSALHDIEDVQNIIAFLKEKGMKVSLDDFGTGYASLAYLKKLNVDYLKLDKSFVMDILTDSGDLSILDATIGLAEAFRSQVIAEGVESPEHGELLIQFGCVLAQGYTIAKPMPPEAFVEWSKTWKPYPAWTQLKPVSSRLFPYLYAGTEHRSWLNDLQLFMQGETDVLPQLDHHKCQFGKWLYGEGKTLISSENKYALLELLHKRLHQLSEDLIKSRDKVSKDVWEVSLKGLKEVHLELLELIKDNAR